MYITIEVRVSKTQYSYNNETGKAEIHFEIDDIGADYIIETLAPLIGATAKTALEKYRNPKLEDE